MKVLINLFWLLLVCFSLQAQDFDMSPARVIDSLETKLKITKNDTDKVVILNNLANKYIETGVYDKAIVLLNSSVAISKKMKYKKQKDITHDT